MYDTEVMMKIKMTAADCIKLRNIDGRDDGNPDLTSKDDQQLYYKPIIELSIYIRLKFFNEKRLF